MSQATSRFSMSNSTWVALSLGLCLFGCDGPTERKPQDNPVSGERPADQKAVARSEGDSPSTRVSFLSVEAEVAAARFVDVIDPSDWKSIEAGIMSCPIDSDPSVEGRDHLHRDLAQFISYYCSPTQQSLEIALIPNERPLNKAVCGEVAVFIGKPVPDVQAGNSAFLSLLLTAMVTEATGRGDTPDCIFVKAGWNSDGLVVRSHPATDLASFMLLDFNGRSSGNFKSEGTSMFDLEGELPERLAKNGRITVATAHLVLQRVCETGDGPVEANELVSANFVLDSKLKKWLPTSVTVRGDANPLLLY